MGLSCALLPPHLEPPRRRSHVIKLKQQGLPNPLSSIPDCKGGGLWKGGWESGSQGACLKAEPRGIKKKGLAKVPSTQGPREKEVMGERRSCRTWSPERGRQERKDGGQSAGKEGSVRTNSWSK